jgi:hypothetical protein
MASAAAPPAPPSAPDVPTAQAGTGPPATTPLQAISGVNGYIAMLNGTSTPITGDAFTAITKMPGGGASYPPNQLWAVSDRTHKIVDPATPPVVYNPAATVVPATQYRFLYGGGYILFYTPLTGTPVVTADLSYITTSGPTDVMGLLHVSNWQLNLTANPIAGDEYGTLIVPQYPGKMNGTWQFERYSSQSGVDLYTMMMLKTRFAFALYESLLENRMWIINGGISAQPMQAPTNAMVGGTVTGTLTALPSMIVESLV